MGTQNHEVDITKAISVVINTYNAEQHLQEVLEAVKTFDEIVICDMESTDSTLAIAKEYGCKIVTFPRGEHNIVEAAREFAIHQISNKWALVVDADEIVTPELREYLYKRIQDADCPEAISIPRLNMFIGKHIVRHSADHQLRFFVAEKTHWPYIIHAKPNVDGRIERIQKNSSNIQLLHLDDLTLTETFDKNNRYTDNEVERKSNKRYGVIALFWRPFWRFFRSYFLQGNILLGTRGIILSCNAAIYQYLIVSKMMEKRLRDSISTGEKQ